MSLSIAIGCDEEFDKITEQNTSNHSENVQKVYFQAHYVYVNASFQRKISRPNAVGVIKQQDIVVFPKQDTL